MANAMRILINRKFYKTAEEAQKKIDIFFAVGRISEDEYMELAGLIADKYSE